MSGEELRAIRESWKMTQLEFGRLLGYSDETISNLENGRREITESMKKHILVEQKLREIAKIMRKNE